ncbi:hypothetical protein MTR67_026239 [Solanum verrucosum]|uniref:Uncharacterized protein n=1 Tax=Solanum verrucosum TaxID=315347 RepID=A0AAF0R7C3_SOLVR|nr:hypothetical protein MTR67_026239 [Solanum verrucosum]
MNDKFIFGGLNVVSSVDGGMGRYSYIAQVLPLHPDLRAKFNETAAWEYARSMAGKSYGYHNLIFSWIDTIDGNYPPPVDAHLVLRDSIAEIRESEELMRVGRDLVDLHGQMVLLENYSALNYIGFRVRTGKTKGREIWEQHLSELLFSLVSPDRSCCQWPSSCAAAARWSCCSPRLLAVHRLLVDGGPAKKGEKIEEEGRKEGEAEGDERERRRRSCCPRRTLPLVAGAALAGERKKEEGQGRLAAQQLLAGAALASGVVDSPESLTRVAARCCPPVFAGVATSRWSEEEKREKGAADLLREEENE